MMQPANKGRRYPPEPLTDDEFRALLAAIKGRGVIAVRNRALLALLWGSGLRISEALALKPRDFRSDSVLVRHGKGDTSRVAGLRPDSVPFVAAWSETRDRLGLNGRQSFFCTVANGAAGKGVRTAGEPLDSSYVRRLLPRLAASAGIEKRVHPHAFRHGHAAMLVERGVPLHAIAGQLGHARPSTTDVYVARIAPAHRLALLADGWADHRSDRSVTLKGESVTRITGNRGQESRFVESMISPDGSSAHGSTTTALADLARVLLGAIEEAGSRKAEDVASGSPHSPGQGIP
jgi:integrase/recombinase XerD